MRSVPILVANDLVAVTSTIVLLQSSTSRRQHLEAAGRVGRCDDYLPFQFAGHQDDFGGFLFSRLLIRLSVGASEQVFLGFIAGYLRSFLARCAVPFGKLILGILLGALAWVLGCVAAHPNEACAVPMARGTSVVACPLALVIGRQQAPFVVGRVARLP
ncbi:Aste57867_17899 [Aphanomyces stellatus]|uniref:Aste57867_17899 protein n=1 Tax=Aphanomyces stellatus TaxID=120398 RepID=A0A485L914_9STRA|nr:hypothetical protein As57867_017838 [Aphanomyces stellatus]VFT94641.1 Aste57867_17899 [Aphanomyces stellatus]